MTREKTAIIPLFTVNPRDGVNVARVYDSHNRRQSGFSLLELVILLMIIGTLSFLAVIGAQSILTGLRANQAMNEVAGCFREARELARTQNREVSIQFPEGGTRIDVRIWDNAINGWTNIEKRDPSVTLRNGYEFTLPDSIPGLNAPEGGALTSPIIFDGNEVEPGGGDRFNFIPDGFLTTEDDQDSPINATIVIGLTGGDNRYARAVTILGATGRTRVFHLKSGAWERSR